jgi:hypothetical protein
MATSKFSLIGVFCVFFFFTGSILKGQNIILQPALQADSDGNYEAKLLYKAGRTLRFVYNTNLDNVGASLKIGRVSNNYSVTEYEVSGTQREFNPTTVGLKAGKYFARIANSDFDEFSNIKNDSRPGLVYSNEIQFIVEAPKAAKVIAPRGGIDSPTPTFEWQAVEGVKSYWVIVSSTAFDITTDENDDISIEGANLVWQFITSQTSAQYGDINFNTPYQDEAPPLNPNREYSYTILNLFEEDNPVFASAVFGGIVPFTYEVENPIPAPTIISPANETTFDGDETITFSWTEVDEAENYDVNLYEVITQNGVDASIPIWSVTTSNAIVDYPAFGSLKNSTYKWNVVARDNEGGGTTSGTAESPTNSFDYNIPLGSYRISAISSVDNSTLIGLEVNARAISGGVTPKLPIFVQSTSASDDLVAGTYQFTSVKEGYKEIVRTATINEGKTTNIRFTMEGLPASVSGKVQDKNGNAVNEAIVELTNIVTGEMFSTKSESTGNFNVSAPEGTYEVSIRKTGYKTRSPGTLTLALNQQLLLDNPYEIEKFQVIISGYVVNERGNGIRLARVIANNGNGEVIELRSNGEGYFRILVSPGTWKLSASKGGFVLNSPKNVTVLQGQNLENQNINMVSAANQISGFAREVIIGADGGVGYAPLSEVEIRAVPSSGSVVYASSSSSGSYNLDLKTGSYTITASKEGFESSSQAELSLGNGETVNGINVDLTVKTSSVSGRVVGGDGNGLSGVTLTVIGDQVQSVTTRSGGYYNLSLSSGSHTIRAKLAGYTSKGDRNVSLNAGQSLSGIDFKLTPNAVVIKGAVKGAGKELAFSTISAENSAGEVTEEQTDDLGNYTLSLKPGEWNVSAVKYGYAASEVKSVALDAGQEIQGVDFSLISTTRTIQGRVTSGGSSLRNAQALLLSTDGVQLKDTPTKVDGTFSFLAEVDQGYIVEIRKEGYNTAKEEITNLEPGANRYSLEVILQTSPSQIKGSVLTTAGVPIKGANITLLQNNDIIASINADFKGAYALGVDAGEYQLRVMREGFKTKTQKITIAFGEVRSGLNFNLAENFALYRGTVEDELGNPIQGVFLKLSSEEIGYSGASDENGVYTMTKIVKGTYDFSAVVDGYDSEAIENIEIAAGANISNSVVLVSRQGKISGTVGGSESQVGISGATVTAFNPEGESFSTATNSIGEFEINELGFDNYSLEVTKSGYLYNESVEVTLSADSPTKEDAVLPIVLKSGVISGTITDGDTQAAVGSAEIIATGLGTDRTLTNNGGLYSISGLSTGTYEIRVVKDKYATKTDTVIITNEAPKQTVDLDIIQNIGTIQGQVSNQNGTSLGRTISLSATSADATFETLSNTNGNFIFSGIPKGKTYVIQTAAVGEGLINSEREIVFEASETELVLSSALEIQENKSIITGNAGIGGASVDLYNNNNQLVRSKISEPSGGYRFQNLAAGTYNLEFSASGYIFNPSNAPVNNLGFNDIATINVAAVENSADVQLAVQNGSGEGVSGANVILISQDKSIRYEALTNENGIALIENADVSKTYGVFVSKDGFSLGSELPKDITLTAGSAESISVQLVRNNNNLYGVVNRSDNEAPLEDARVVLSATDGTFQQNVQTNSTGEYFVTSIPRKTYSLNVLRSGFDADTLEFDISDLPLEQKEYEGSAYNFSIVNNVSLTPAFINVRGRVLSNIGGVESAQIKVIGSTEKIVSTNSAGSFAINRFPVSLAAQDTIAISVEMKFGSVSQVKTQLITRNKLGTNVGIENFIIPSGQIRGSLTDGSNAISGVEVTVTRPGRAAPVSLITNNEGLFVTDSTLKSGTYGFTINTRDYLTPLSQIQVELESNSSRIETELVLPFKFSAPDSIQAAFETPISIAVNGEFDIASANLYFKRQSASVFDTLSMVVADGELTTVLPAQNNQEPLQFYTEVSVVQDSSELTYVSDRYERELGALGLLDEVLLNPVVNNLAIRTNDVYNLDVFVKDGSNNIMAEFESGAAGTIELLNSSEGITVVVDNESKTVTLETGDDEINGSFQIAAQLRSQRIVTSFLVNVQKVEIADLAIQEIRGGILSNEESYSFGISAQDSSGNRFMLGNNVQWKVQPLYFGQITNEGLFTPSTNTIGEFNVVVTDPSSGKIDSSSVIGLFANVSPEASTTLKSGSELELTFPAGALNDAGIVKLKNREPETPKQFVVPFNSNKSFKSSNNIYNITLEGTELNSDVSLQLSSGTEFRLNEGEIHVAHFDDEQLQWEILPSEITQDSLVKTNQVSSFSQFALLIENEPLGLKYFAVLPNPFSPEVAPAKIGYQLNSQNPPAYVTIRIYNMRGQLVRTLLDRDAQMPGIYGSFAGQKEVEWDGLTDNGDQARNGRYAVHIIIEDGTDRKKYLKSLVLIK